jgi:hypothetical protein
VDKLSVDIADAAQNVASSGENLDYSEASLAAVEAMLEEAGEFFPEMPEETQTNVVQNFGCYILEVGRRQFGGEYLWHPQYKEPVLVVGEPEFHIGLAAWSKVRGRLQGDKGNNIPFHYAGFANSVREAKSGTRKIYL